MEYYLPAKIPSYLLRLSLQYARSNQELHPLIIESHVFVIEGVEYNNWDGGTYGHNVVLYVPLTTLSKVEINRLEKVTATILSDLKKVAGNLPNEFIASVRLETNDENDPNFQRARLISEQPKVLPESLSIWKPGYIRLFISHRDACKAKANELATALEPYGFSSFVAHDTIAPMREWRKEIVKALETMEVMLVFLTDDFAESDWTNQEVGFALGANKPIVTVKLGVNDPPGFISHMQALRADASSPLQTACDLLPYLAKATNEQARVQGALVQSFADTPDWGEARPRFDRMGVVVEKLTESELKLIVDAFYQNDQLHNAGYLTNKNYQRLHAFLRRTTGKEFSINNRKIVEIDKDDIPF